MKTPEGSVNRILVVEDEPAICELCRRILTEDGFEVDIAVNGKVAQDMLAERQYDLCLFDIRLPLVNGIELYQWLQEKHPQLAGRVIFATGSVMGEDTQSFLEQSGRPFLLKPFTADELKAIIRETLEEIEK